MLGDRVLGCGNMNSTRSLHRLHQLPGITTITVTGGGTFCPRYLLLPPLCSPPHPTQGSPSWPDKAIYSPFHPRRHLRDKRAVGDIPSLPPQLHTLKLLPTSGGGRGGLHMGGWGLSIWAMIAPSSDLTTQKTTFPSSLCPLRQLPEVRGYSGQPLTDPLISLCRSHKCRGKGWGSSSYPSLPAVLRARSAPGQCTH